MSEAATAPPADRARRGASEPDWRWLVPAARMAAAAWRVATAGRFPETAGRFPGTVRSLPGGGDGTPSHVATRTTHGRPEAVRDAREFTAATLAEWGVAERRDDIVIVVSELLTNALRHARPAPVTVPAHVPARVGLLLRGPCLLCAVADASDQVPVRHEPDYLAETGRGLHVIASLADGWGCTVPGPAGKVVWASFFAAAWR